VREETHSSRICAKYISSESVYSVTLEWQKRPAQVAEWSAQEHHISDMDIGLTQTGENVT